MNYRIAYLADGVRATTETRASHAAAAVSATNTQCLRLNKAFELLSVQLRNTASQPPLLSGASKAR